jgi:hypothetical protein
MYKHSVALAALLVLHLISPRSGAFAQAASGTAEMATGDVWSSREELAYVPREALELPDAISPGDIEIATGDIWPSRKKPIHIPQQALVPNDVDAYASGRAHR